MKEILLLLFFFLSTVKGGDRFEESRCRCICPDPKILVNNTAHDYDEKKRVYTNKTDPDLCNARYVVGTYPIAKHIMQEVDGEKLFQTFIERCQCIYQTRNTTLLKVVISLVICIILILLFYMIFLVILDPMLRSRRGVVKYEPQTNEEDNIFASTDSPEAGSSTADDRREAAENLRARNSSSGGVLGRVEQEQNKWMKSVEAQRRNIFTDHTMLN